MKHTLKKFGCLLLALCLVVALLPAGASAAEGQETTDYVLILDCSGSMAKNDRAGLAAEACMKFIDQLPIENTRLAVIAYGYNGKGYDYEYFNVKYDANLIQVLSGLSGTVSDSDDEKQELKDSIENVTTKDRGSNPTSAIGQALAAGVDLLLQGGATDGNACLILLSDGDSTSAIAYGESDSLAESVPHKAKEHNWPVYCIELDYQGKNETSAGSENRKRLTNICVNSGAGADARMKVRTPAEVDKALMTIFNRFMKMEDPVIETGTFDENGVATKSWEVPELASETNFIISSRAVEYIEVTTPGGATQKVSADNKTGDWRITYEEGSYICVKVVCPEPGTWKVTAYGDPEADITFHNVSPQEQNLELIGSPASGRVTKNDKITLQAYFTYAGKNMKANNFYEKNPATAVVTSYDAAGAVKAVSSFEMTGDTNGYHLDLDVSKIPSGKFSVQAVLEHVMFRTGEQKSNALTYASENLPLEHDETQNIDRSGMVNGELEVIDLTKVFPNPDGDPVEYEVLCTDDRNHEFEYVVDDNDYLTIHTKFLEGVHNMQVTAKDPDMTEPLVHAFVVTVENTPIKEKKIPEQELWSDAYDFQDAGNMELDLDLNDYFSDPDGVALTYGEITASAQGLVTVTCDNGMLHVEPVSKGVKGDVVLTTTVSDGVSTIPAEIRIEVVDGTVEFWADNWIWFALAAGVLLLIIIIIIVIRKNILVKGVWRVTMTNENGESCYCADVNIPVLTACGKKRKFFLVNLISELSVYMQGSSDPVNEYMNYFAGAAAKVELRGVLSGKGCSVKNIPSDGSVFVSVNGLERKNPEISSGVLTFQFKNPMNPSASLTISMELM